MEGERKRGRGEIQAVMKIEMMIEASEHSLHEQGSFFKVYFIFFLTVVLVLTN